MIFPSTARWGRDACNSGSFDPTTLFAGETGGWWQPSDLSTLFQGTDELTPVTAAGQAVGRINDKSGNGNHLLQPTGSRRPLLQTDGSLWWLEFDSVANQFLTATFTFAQPITYVFAVQARAWLSAARMIEGSASGSNVGVLQQVASPTIAVFNAGLGAPQADLPLGENHVVTAVLIDFSSAKLAIDNGAYAAGDDGSGSNQPAGITVGARADGAGAMALNWLGGIAIGRQLTDTDVAACRAFFGAEAGLSL